MAVKGIEQGHIFMRYQSVIFIVIDYGLGLTSLSQSNLLKLNRVYNKAMGVILENTYTHTHTHTHTHTLWHTHWGRAPPSERATNES